MIKKNNEQKTKINSVLSNSDCDLIFQTFNLKFPEVHSELHPLPTDHVTCVSLVC